MDKIKISSSHVYFKVIAAITLFAFSVTQVTYAQGPLQVPLPADQKLSLPIPEHLDIPDDIGSIQEEYQSEKKGPFVVFIQDAHVIVDAQSNIENLIRHLQGKYGIRLVALEGGKGKMDPTLLRTFPDGNIKKHVMDGYLARGEVTGGELSAVLNEKEAKYFGIEDWRLYEENYVAFLRAMQRKEMMLTELEEKKQGLDEERKTVYSEAHNEFHAHVQAFREEKEHLMTLLQYLKGVEAASVKASEQDSQMSKKFPHLWVLYKSIEKDAKMDKEELEGTIRDMSDKFKQKYWRSFTKEQTMEWNSKYQDFVTGRSDAGAYLKHLMAVSGEMGHPVRLTAGMRELLGHVETMATIKGTKMFTELEEFINDLEEGVMKSDEERKVSEMYKRLLIMKDLAGLELTREKLEKMQLDAKEYLGLLKRPGLADSALEFYRLAVERDRALQRNLLDLMKREGEQSAIVLAGGFHTEGFAKGLKEEGCSYVLVTPRINSLKGHELYEEVMKGKLSYKDMIKTTFYDAFMRHSSMKLVAELNERDFRKVVKEWRDGVIRKLAEEGRTAEAGEYTKYIDLLMKVYIEKYGVDALTKKSKEEVLKDIEKALSDYEEKTLSGMWEKFEGTLKRFTEGAQGLIDLKEISVEKVADLLRAAASPVEPAAGGRLDSRLRESASPIEQSAVKASKLQAVRGILDRKLTEAETKDIIRLAGDVSAETLATDTPLENVREQAVTETVGRYFGEKAATLTGEPSQARIDAAMPAVNEVVTRVLDTVKVTEQVPADVRKLPAPSAQMTGAMAAQVKSSIASAAPGLTEKELAVAVQRAIQARQEDQKPAEQPTALAQAASIGRDNRGTAQSVLSQTVAPFPGEYPHEMFDILRDGRTFNFVDLIHQAMPEAIDEAWEKSGIGQRKKPKWNKPSGWVIAPYGSVLYFQEGGRSNWAELSDVDLAIYIDLGIETSQLSDRERDAYIEDFSRFIDYFKTGINQKIKETFEANDFEAGEISEKGVPVDLAGKGTLKIEITPFVWSFPVLISKGVLQGAFQPFFSYFATPETLLLMRDIVLRMSPREIQEILLYEYRDLWRRANDMYKEGRPKGLHRLGQLAMWKQFAGLNKRGDSDFVDFDELFKTAIRHKPPDKKDISLRGKDGKWPPGRKDLEDAFTAAMEKLDLAGREDELKAAFLAYGEKLIGNLKAMGESQITAAALGKEVTNRKRNGEKGEKSVVAREELTRERLLEKAQAVLADPHPETGMVANELLNYLENDELVKFEVNGVKRDHTVEVLKKLANFTKKGGKLPDGVDARLFPIILALHDVGDDPFQKHDKTIEIVQELLGEKKLGFEPREINLAVALIDGDPLGMYFIVNNTDRAGVIALMIEGMQRKTDLGLADFFKLLTIYYQCDAGGHGLVAPTLLSDELDPENHRLKFIGTKEELFKALEEEIERLSTGKAGKKETKPAKRKEPPTPKPAPAPGPAEKVPKKVMPQSPLVIRRGTGPRGKYYLREQIEEPIPIDSAKIIEKILASRDPVALWNTKLMDFLADYMKELMAQYPDAMSKVPEGDLPYYSHSVTIENLPGMPTPEERGQPEKITVERVDILMNLLKKNNDLARDRSNENLRSILENGLFTLHQMISLQPAFEYATRGGPSFRPEAVSSYANALSRWGGDDGITLVFFPGSVGGQIQEGGDGGGLHSIERWISPVSEEKAAIPINAVMAIWVEGGSKGHDLIKQVIRKMRDEDPDAVIPPVFEFNQPAKTGALLYNPVTNTWRDEEPALRDGETSLSQAAALGIEMPPNHPWLNKDQFSEYSADAVWEVKVGDVADKAAILVVNVSNGRLVVRRKSNPDEIYQRGPNQSLKAGRAPDGNDIIVEAPMVSRLNHFTITYDALSNTVRVQNNVKNTVSVSHSTEPPHILPVDAEKNAVNLDFEEIMANILKSQGNPEPPVTNGKITISDDGDMAFIDIGNLALERDEEIAFVVPGSRVPNDVQEFIGQGPREQLHARMEDSSENKRTLQPVIDSLKRELVNATEEEKMVRVFVEVSNRLGGMEQESIDLLKFKYQSQPKLAAMVAKLRPTSSYVGKHKNSYEILSRVSQIVRDYENQPLGIGYFMEQEAGVCRHRAFLFYLLANAVGLNAILKRGNVPGGRHAWGEVVLSDSRRVFVDVFYNPNIDDYVKEVQAREFVSQANILPWQHELSVRNIGLGANADAFAVTAEPLAEGGAYIKIRAKERFAPGAEGRVQYRVRITNLGENQPGAHREFNGGKEYKINEANLQLEEVQAAQPVNPVNEPAQPADEQVQPVELRPSDPRMSGMEQPILFEEGKDYELGTDEELDAVKAQYDGRTIQIEVAGATVFLEKENNEWVMKWVEVEEATGRSVERRVSLPVTIDSEPERTFVVGRGFGNVDLKNHARARFISRQHLVISIGRNESGDTVHIADVASKNGTTVRSLSRFAMDASIDMSMRESSWNADGSRYEKSMFSFIGVSPLAVKWNGYFPNGLEGVPQGSVRELLEAIQEVEAEEDLHLKPGSIVVYGGALRNLLRPESVRKNKLTGDIDILIRTPEGVDEQAGYSQVKKIRKRLKEVVERRIAEGKFSKDLFVDYLGTFTPDGTVIPKPGLEQFLGRIQESFNTMMMRSDGKILDLHGGQKDLDNGVVRYVGESREDIRLAANHMTVMRTVRFKNEYYRLGPKGEKIPFEYERETEDIVNNFFKNQDFPERKKFNDWLADAKKTQEYRRLAMTDKKEALKFAHSWLRNLYEPSAGGVRDKAYFSFGAAYVENFYYAIFQRTGLNLEKTLKMNDAAFEKELQGKFEGQNAFRLDDALRAFEEYMSPLSGKVSGRFPPGTQVPVDLDEGKIINAKEDPYAIGYNLRDIMAKADNPEAAAAEIVAIGLNEFLSAAGIDLDAVLRDRQLRQGGEVLQADMAGQQYGQPRQTSVAYQDELMLAGVKLDIRILGNRLTIQATIPDNGVMGPPQTIFDHEVKTEFTVKIGSDARAINPREIAGRNIKEPHVSRNHLAIRNYGNGIWKFMDLNSTNGVFYGGNPVGTGWNAFNLVPQDNSGSLVAVAKQLALDAGFLLREVPKGTDYLSVESEFVDRLERAFQNARDSHRFDNNEDAQILFTLGELILKVVGEARAGNFKIDSLTALRKQINRMKDRLVKETTIGTDILEKWESVLQAYAAKARQAKFREPGKNVRDLKLEESSVSGASMGTANLTPETPVLELGKVALPTPSRRPRVNPEKARLWIENEKDPRIRAIKEKILNRIQHVTFEEFERELSATIESLNTAIGSVAHAFLWDYKPHSSKRWVYEMAKSSLAKVPEVATYFSPAKEKELNTIGKIVDQGIDTFVILDDSSYSGEQIVNKAINPVLKYYRERASADPSFNRKPSFIVAAPFMASKAVEVLKQKAGEDVDIEIIQRQQMPTLSELLSEDDKRALQAREGKLNAEDEQQTYLGATVTFFDHRIADGHSFSDEVRLVMDSDYDKPYGLKGTAYYEQEGLEFDSYFRNVNAGGVTDSAGLTVITGSSMGTANLSPGEPVLDLGIHTPADVTADPIDTDAFYRRQLAIVEQGVAAADKTMNIDNTRFLYIETVINRNSYDTAEYVKLTPPEVEWLMARKELFAYRVTFLDGKSRDMLFAPGLADKPQFYVLLRMLNEGVDITTQWKLLFARQAREANRDDVLAALAQKSSSGLAEKIEELKQRVSIPSVSGAALGKEATTADDFDPDRFVQERQQKEQEKKSKLRASKVRDAVSRLFGKFFKDHSANETNLKDFKDLVKGARELQPNGRAHIERNDTSEMKALVDRMTIYPSTSMVSGTQYVILAYEKEDIGELLPGQAAAAALQGSNAVVMRASRFSKVKAILPKAFNLIGEGNFENALANPEQELGEEQRKTLRTFLEKLEHEKSHLDFEAGSTYDRTKGHNVHSWVSDAWASVMGQVMSQYRNINLDSAARQTLSEEIGRKFDYDLFDYFAGYGPYRDAYGVLSSQEEMDLKALGFALTEIAIHAVNAEGTNRKEVWNNLLTVMHKNSDIASSRQALEDILGRKSIMTADLEAHQGQDLLIVVLEDMEESGDFSGSRRREDVLLNAESRQLEAISKSLQERLAQKENVTEGMRIAVQIQVDALEQAAKAEIGSPERHAAENQIQERLNAERSKYLAVDEAITDRLAAAGFKAEVPAQVEAPAEVAPPAVEEAVPVVAKSELREPTEAAVGEFFSSLLDMEARSQEKQNPSPISSLRQRNSIKIGKFTIKPEFNIGGTWFAMTLTHEDYPAWQHLYLNKDANDLAKGAANLTAAALGADFATEQRQILRKKGFNAVSGIPTAQVYWNWPSVVNAAVAERFKDVGEVRLRELEGYFQEGGYIVKFPGGLFKKASYTLEGEPVSKGEYEFYEFWKTLHSLQTIQDYLPAQEKERKISLGDLRGFLRPFGASIEMRQGLEEIPGALIFIQRAITALKPEVRQSFNKSISIGITEASYHADAMVNIGKKYLYSARAFMQMFLHEIAHPVVRQIANEAWRSDEKFRESYERVRSQRLLPAFAGLENGDERVTYVTRLKGSPDRGVNTELMAEMFSLLALFPDAMDQYRESFREGSPERESLDYVYDFVRNNFFDPAAEPIVNLQPGAEQTAAALGAFSETTLNLIDQSAALVGLSAEQRQMLRHMVSSPYQQPRQSAIKSFSHFKREYAAPILDQIIQECYGPDLLAAFTVASDMGMFQNADELLNHWRFTYANMYAYAGPEAEYPIRVSTASG